jgi:hypothetical protein
MTAQRDKDLLSRSTLDLRQLDAPMRNQGRSAPTALLPIGGAIGPSHQGHGQTSRCDQHSSYTSRNSFIQLGIHILATMFFRYLTTLEMNHVLGAGITSHDR